MTELGFPFPRYSEQLTVIRALDIGLRRRATEDEIHAVFRWIEDRRSDLLSIEALMHGWATLTLDDGKPSFTMLDQPDGIEHTWLSCGLPRDGLEPSEWFSFPVPRRPIVD